nr:VWA domain-containing protein [Pseudoclavibacter chungangensis]
MRILAGSEVQDMQPILDDLERETGVRVEFEFMGTLDGTEALLSASEDRAWDATWFPSNRYLSLFPEGQSLIDRSESIMRSPVAFGVKPDVAQRLGWSDDAQPTWQDIVAAIEAGELTYGMTSPVSSNSGFTTLVQLTTALSGTGTVLEPADIERTTPQLEGFAAGQQLASGSSGWLAERFAEQPDLVDGVFNYESVLRGTTVGGQELQVVIPSNGVVTSDYPLTLLAGANEDKTASFTKAVEYLLRDDVQERIANETLRRTTATPPSVDATVFELPFPNQLDTVQSLLTTWVGSIKKPSNMVFAIDTSGSMGEGDRMDQLRAALGVLSGEQDSTSGQLLKLQPRERITYLEFAASIKSEFTVDIPSDEAGYASALATINERTSSYSPQGGTAIYDTLETAYEQVLAGAGDDRISSIVLFTDGENTDGIDASTFRSRHEQLVRDHPEVASVPVFVVLFGEGDVDELTSLAESTGGRAFDGTSTSLSSVFREIRGYL